MVGFGNARAIKDQLHDALARRATRITALTQTTKQDKLLTRDDLLGPAINKASLQQLPAYQSLNGMIGLASVKKNFQRLLKVAADIEAKESAEQPVSIPSLNRVFVGNPGTGKTDVATKYGLLLKQLGLLSKGHVMVKRASEFIGEYVGKSAALTNQILLEAVGGVLIIDEAYSWYTSSGGGIAGNSNAYGTDVINTIVEQVQPGEDRVIVLLGYEEDMTEMFNVCLLWLL